MISGTPYHAEVDGNSITIRFATGPKGQDTNTFKFVCADEEETTEAFEMWLVLFEKATEFSKAKEDEEDEDTEDLYL